jgi:hypothetical protein
MTKNKTAITMATLLVLTFTISLIALPASNAHTPAWKMETWAYIAAAPNPVGVGQKVFINMWVDKPMPEATVFNDIRRHSYQLNITKPDGQILKQTFDLSDTTGVQFYTYVPDQVGEYSCVFYYPGQVYTWNSTAAERVFTNDVFLPATSKTVTFTVQQDPIPEALSSYPLPTEYWTRPIEGENTDWSTFSSNYLRGAQIIDGAYQKDGLAPNSAHIMWTKPLDDGGVVGGTNTGINGMTYYSGLSYETKFMGTIIMNGRLYYPLSRSNNGAGNGYAVVDLRTGEEIYRSDMSMPSFGQLEWFDSENQHGVIPNGYLWYSSGTTRMIYDSLDGKNLFNITNVPSGTMAYGPNGEILIYSLNVASKSLALWNFTACFPPLTGTSSSMSQYRPVGQIINGSNAYSWNVTTSALRTGSTIRYTITDDVLLFSNIATSYNGRYGTNDPYTMGAISLKPASRGQLLWMTDYAAPQPQNNTVGTTRVYLTTDPINRVILLRDKETLINYGYSLDTGNLLWTTSPLTQVPDWEYFSTSGFTAYGKFYYSGYGGIVYAFDTKDGSILWTYGQGGEGNSTNTGLQTPWGLYPINIGAIADGKIYLFGSEHSPNEPMYKNVYVTCLDANTGDQIWRIKSFANPGSFMAPGFAIADGYMAYLNLYDKQIYVIGKGPSATTVSASPKVSTYGSSVIIEGTVTDIAAGTKQKEQAARFPAGVPAVSDASQSEWMEYVYMQKPRPMSTTGVPIALNVVDANGNYRQIGSTTSDADGFFAFNWKPDIEGQYTVYASFAGSESYWPSHAVTSFAVDAAAPTPSTTEAPAQSVSDMYFVPAVAGIIAAIVVVGLMIILVLRKRS